MEKTNKKNKPGSIGGQAVIEGVMMRGTENYALAVRTPENEIVIELTPISKVQRNKFFKLPVIRGIFAFVDSLVIGTKTIMRSATLAGFDEEEVSKDKVQTKKTQKVNDKKQTDILIYLSVALSVVLGVALFMLLPVFIASFFKNALPGTWSLGILEGLIRFCVFLLYVVLISRMKDIKRVFEYHGAEHKTINCHESKNELTVENVRRYSRFHKRCGTSFLLIVMIISMALFLFVRTDVIWLRFVTRIIFVPLIAGLSYEIIRWAGKHESLLVDIISFPGMCVQRLTTAEPDESQIEVAIASVKAVLEKEELPNAE